MNESWKNDNWTLPDNSWNELFDNIDFSKINDNIETQSEHYSKAPYKTPVRRLDETLANRSLDVKYKNE